MVRDVLEKWDLPRNRESLALAEELEEQVSEQSDVDLANKEGTLGNPASDGYYLVSTAAGVRSWSDAPLPSNPPSGMKKVLNVYWDDATNGPVWVVSDTAEP